MKTIVNADGSIYTGELLNCKFHGNGTLIYTDGTKYVGEFKNGHLDGKGAWTYPNGEDGYFGEFKNDNYDGFGTSIFGNLKYVGEFKNGEYHGIGSHFSTSSDTYIGEYKKGYPNGNGAKISTDYKYFGKVKDFALHGKGALIRSTGVKYIGEFKNNYQHGKGTLIYPNGTKLIGEFKKGELHGNAIMILPTGEKLVGAYMKNDIDKINDGPFYKNLQTKLINKNQDKYYLFFDTETTGLPISFNASLKDINNWPRLVQLAFLLYDNEGNKIFSGDYIIKPIGFTIPNDVSKIHGITTDKANSDGHSLQAILQYFEILCEQADYLVAHNIAFDEKIIGSEYLRNGMPNSIKYKRKICTMEKTTNFCAIGDPGYYKWPKLSELHYKLFRTGYEEAHNAAADVEITAKCFWELKKLKIL